MKYIIFRCDCIVILAQLIEHAEDSLMYVCTTNQKVSTWLIMQIGESSLDFPHFMYCIPCCGPELGVSLAVEGVVSLVGVFFFPVI